MIINRLSRVMGDRRLSIQEVVRVTGVSYSTVFDLYHAKAKRFDLNTLDRLCTGLGVGVGDILEHQADPPAE
jgi:putative transcriptional regulator